MRCEGSKSVVVAPALKLKAIGGEREMGFTHLEVTHQTSSSRSRHRDNDDSLTARYGEVVRMADNRWVFQSRFFLGFVGRVGCS